MSVSPAVPPYGRHLLIDMAGASRLDDEAYIRDACEAAARATGATVLKSEYHHFGEGCGVTGITLLQESHLSIHTWQEDGVALIDVFVCGNCDPRLAVPILIERFMPSSIDVRDLHRGPGRAENNEDVMAKLVSQLEAMIEESGDPSGFDARAWMQRWLGEPLPAFGGARPADFMGTEAGRALVSATLAKMQSGAYA